MPNGTVVAGTHGTLAPFPIGQKVSGDDFPAYTQMLGMEIEAEDGKKYRLVRLNNASGVTAPEYLAFGFTVAWSSDNPYDVTTALYGGTPNRVCGFGVPDQAALEDNDIFWIQFDGPYIEVFLGDDGTDVAQGAYLRLDDDADRGKVRTVDTTFDAEFTLGVSLDTNTGTDAVLKMRPLHPLRG